MQRLKETDTDSWRKAWKRRLVVEARGRGERKLRSRESNIPRSHVSSGVEHVI